MRCALYCRVSTTDQNCEMQLRELREFIFRREWKIAGEYVDTGFSGAKASRPARKRALPNHLPLELCDRCQDLQK
jgi:DNA invertase Pin-like site-specific DNA recombinase